MLSNKQSVHWEKVYEQKTPDQVSWTQEYPIVSLEMIDSFGTDKSAPIIDIGGGDSLLVDFLLQREYTDVTVLDISSRALKKAKFRLGEMSERVHWIVADIRDFVPDRIYRIWHDRATFHFLTAQEDIERYAAIVNTSVDGYITIGTFSSSGPEKCSGLSVSRYDEVGLSAVFDEEFHKIECRAHKHITPMQTVQDFLFCSFKKNKSK